MKKIAVFLMCAFALGASAQSPNRDYSNEKIRLLKRDAKLMPRFIPLEIGEIQPEGWIRDWSKLAANGITGHLDEYQPVYTHGWKGYGFEAVGANAEDGTGWPIEQCSYWMDGAVKLAYQLGDEKLIDKISQRLDIIVDGVLDKGGETFIWWKEKSITDNWFNNWGHGIMGRALISYYQATHSPRVLEAIRKVYSKFALLSPWTNLNSIDGEMSLMRGATNVDAMSEAYIATGDTAILNRLVEYSQRPLMKKYEDILYNVEGRDKEGFKTLHGVTFYEGLRVPAILSMWTGDLHEREVSRKFLNWGLEYNLLPLGVTSSEENLSGVGAMRSVETCDVPASMWAYTWMTRLTGESSWLDLTESAFLNAGPAPVARDFKTMSYYQQLNRLSETLPGDAPIPGEGCNKFTPYGHSVLCCVGSCNWIIPNYVENMWMATVDGGLAFTLYGPCRVVKYVGKKRVHLDCATDFPFDDKINITLAAVNGSVDIPLYFRVPDWTEGMTVEVNGKKQDIEAYDGFMRINREWQDGDKITLTMPMKVTVSEGKEIPYPRDGYFTKGPLAHPDAINPQVADSIGGAPFQYVKYGPLLYSLPLEDISENEVKPGQDYSYALAIKDVKKDVKIKRGKMGHPWRWNISDAPVTLQVSANKVDWNATWATPLPKSPLAPEGKTKITLVPYNVTKFRVTLFPTTNQ
jgi:uncharacterized protein